MLISHKARHFQKKELRAALVANQFVLHYQRLVTSDGLVAGAEALIRWQHPTKGMIAPREFISTAEQTGLIVPIGLWILETACAHLERWSHRPCSRHLEIAVNVSARQFQESDFADMVREVLWNSGADPLKLRIELTETMPWTTRLRRLG